MSSNAAVIHKQILDEILRVLQEDMTFDVAAEDEGKCHPITKEHIVFRKVSEAERDIDTGKPFELIPGIIVSVPLTEPFDPRAGTNAHDEYRWSFLIQILDRDNWEQTRNIATYFLWQEMIAFRFQFMCVQNLDPSVLHCLANAMSVNVVDERYWIKNKAFKAGVQILTRPWIRGYGR